MDSWQKIWIKISCGFLLGSLLRWHSGSRSVVIETYFKSTLRVAGHVGSNLASCRWTVTRLSLCSAAQRAVSWNYWQTAAMLVFFGFCVCDNHRGLLCCKGVEVQPHGAYPIILYPISFQSPGSALGKEPNKSRQIPSRQITAFAFACAPILLTCFGTENQIEILIKTEQNISSEYPREILRKCL